MFRISSILILIAGLLVFYSIGCGDVEGEPETQKVVPVNLVSVIPPLGEDNEIESKS